MRFSVRGFEHEIAIRFGGIGGLIRERGQSALKSTAEFERLLS
jgi:hypothetical protein